MDFAFIYMKIIFLGYLEDKNKNIKQIIPEHIIINRSIHEKTNKFMLVSDNFFVKTPKEHMPYFSFSEFVKNKLLFFF